MKKLIYAVITTVIVATTMVNVSADLDPFPAPVDQDRVVNTDDPTTQIPVFGYIGQDADITHPEDPDGPLVINPVTTEMRVSVPVRLVWAAFASDGGEIKSPTYKIENKSAFAVDVELTRFENTTTDKDDDMDENIVISLEDLNESAKDVVGMTELELLTLRATGTSNSSIEFNIGGRYTGSFAKPYQPTYRMVLTFSIH